MPEQYLITRRPGHHPGRRCAYALAIAGALLVLAPAARADPAIVSATVYDAQQRTVTHTGVTLATLQGCPFYTGPSPVYVYPSDQPFSTTSDTWALSDVLTCGLHVPLSDLDGVAVQKLSTAYETPLSSAELGPGPYHDPAAPGAVPLLSVDTGANQITYVRPYRGAGDDNGDDEVPQSGGAPVAVTVYENGPPLTVTATSHAGTAGPGASTVDEELSATVTDSSGATVPASALTWSWSFGDGSSSADAAPTHAFAINSSFIVTATVSDAAAGTGGTESITVTTSSQSTPGPPNPNGAGHSHKPKANSGSAGGQGTGAPTGKSGSPQPTSSTPTHSSGSGTPTGGASPATTSSSSTTTSTSASSSTTSATTSTSTTSTTPTSPAGRPHPRHHLAGSAPKQPGPLVSGLLISDLRPVPASASPLIQRPPAPVRVPRVGAATRSSSLAGIGGGLAAVALLTLGAARELRGAGGWRTLRRPG